MRIIDNIAIREMRTKVSHVPKKFSKVQNNATVSWFGSLYLISHLLGDAYALGSSLS